MTRSDRRTRARPHRPHPGEHGVLDGAAKVEKFVVVTGLPRSGTTLLTALVDAHPRVCLFYEPWNSSKRDPPPVPETPAEFTAMMQMRLGTVLKDPVRVTGFKETTILPEAADWAARVADSMARWCPVHIFWIVRHPIHCLLSKLDGMRKWWGYPDASLSQELLASYLRATLVSMEALEALASRHLGVLVSYEGLVSEPSAVLSELMEVLGDRFEPAQLEYYREGPQPEKVMGDLGVAHEPGPVSADRERARFAEAKGYRHLIDAEWNRPEFAALREIVQRLSAVRRVTPLGG